MHLLLFLAPPRVTAEQINKFSKEKGFEKCKFFLKDVDDLAVLLACKTKAPESREESNQDYAPKYFYLSPNKNGKLRKLFKDEQKTDFIKVTFEQGEGTIRNANHQLDKLKEVDFQENNECLMVPKLGGQNE